MCVATSHVGLLGSVTETLNFEYDLIFINLKLNSYTWLIPTVLDHVALDVYIR